MTLTRRNALRACALTIAGAGGLAHTGTRTGLAATADSPDSVELPAEPSDLHIPADDLRVTLDWHGINDTPTTATFSLYVGINGVDDSGTPVATGDISVDAPEGTFDSETDAWATPPAGGGDIDLLSGDGSLADPTFEDGDTLDFLLTFDHDTASTDARASIEALTPTVHTAQIDDSTTHTGLNGSKDTLYSTTILDAGNLDESYNEHKFTISATASGSNQSGSGSYPSIGVRLVNGNGDIVFRFEDIGDWTSEGSRTIPSQDDLISFDENATFDADAETDWHSTLNAPIEGTITAEIYDESGGGGSGDEVNSCTATVELRQR